MKRDQTDRNVDASVKNVEISENKNYRANILRSLNPGEVAVYQRNTIVWKLESDNNFLQEINVKYLKKYFCTYLSQINRYLRRVQFTDIEQKIGEHLNNSTFVKIWSG